MRRTCLLFALAATSAWAADQPTLPSELTLSQALNIALQNSSNLKTAIAQLQQASGRYEQSRSSLLPQVNVGARQDYLTVNLVGIGIPIGAANTKIGPFASMSDRVFLTQELFNLTSNRGWQS